MDDMRQSRMIGGMHMLGEKIMFAIVDRGGDGALSFEEVTAIYKRIFDKVNANRDGKGTMEEIDSGVHTGVAARVRR